ncbi:MarR family transcriptional regulator [Deinococcus koreensis]|uniref:MarR family transcriptional regulator n=1 Tax=Deinococcus koreensis TaxID=2054903 RepID=A0A2K3V081_9DEIO|nr:helix-turn-helix domain-containing protein [Deinococcus koreensis]PNY82181.1 MarR family transcriptional regulator [Deinococcus koreensis]
MTAAPLAMILRAVAGGPRTPAELARALDSSEDALSGMLQTLHTGGYVQEAQPEQEGCACGPCALKSLCRNADSPAPSLTLLKLTARGEVYLGRQRSSSRT